jgi:hypothetical protein
LPDQVNVLSPDWNGERQGTCRAVGDDVELVLPELEAYVVAVLRYSTDVDIGRLQDPIRIVPEARWSRPTRNEFRVRADGTVEHDDELNGFIQGMLHTHLRNPPTFLVNAKTEGRLLVKVRAVAIGGARFEYRVDDRTKQTEYLPDVDGKNDGNAREYDRVLSFPVPPGQHRLALDNVGSDWATVSWLQFQGTFAD